MIVFTMIFAVNKESRLADALMVKMGADKNIFEVL